MQVLGGYPLEVQMACGALIAATAGGQVILGSDPRSDACFGAISEEDGTNPELMNCYWNDLADYTMAEWWYVANNAGFGYDIDIDNGGNGEAGLDEESGADCATDIAGICKSVCGNCYSKGEWMYMSPGCGSCIDSCHGQGECMTGDAGDTPLDSPLSATESAILNGVTHHLPRQLIQIEDHVVETKDTVEKLVKTVAALTDMVESLVRDSKEC